MPTKHIHHRWDDEEREKRMPAYIWFVVGNETCNSCGHVRKLSFFLVAMQMVSVVFSRRRGWKLEDEENESCILYVLY